MKDEHPTGKKPRKPLPSRSSDGQVIGGLLAGAEHLASGRPRPTAQIEERYRDPWASVDGVTVEGLDRPVDRREPLDRSRARL